MIDTAMGVRNMESTTIICCAMVPESVRGRTVS